MSVRSGTKLDELHIQSCPSPADSSLRDITTEGVGIPRALVKGSDIRKDVPGGPSDA